MERALKAPVETPKPAKGEDRETAVNHKAVFFGAMLDMTWQMAIVVIVPIVGGFKLDGLLHTTPALTILGFLVAMAGMFVVMKRAVAGADQRLTPKERHK